METTILEHVTGRNSMEWVNKHRIIDRTAELQMMLYQDTLRLMDISDAMLPAQSCTEFTIQSRERDYLVCNLVRDFATLKNLYRVLDGTPWERGQWGGYRTIEYTYKGQRLYLNRQERDAKRVFSPIHLDRIKPLKSEPKKWTLPLALRAIVNGQYDSLRCRGVYTDDSMQDLRRGDITDPIAFAAGIFESPSGWWVSKRDGVVSICCHTFDLNEFAPNLRRIMRKVA